MLIMIIIFLILFTYLGYPIFLFVFSFMIKSNKINTIQIYPKVSLLIAAYNEDQNIEEKILNSLELDYPKDKIEIVIVSDGSTDKTDEISKKYSKFGIKLFRVDGRVGKTEARNRAVKFFKNEIVVFSDATTIYRKDAILKLVRNFSDDSIGMVSGNLNYLNSGKGNMGIGTLVYWKYEQNIKMAQSHFFTLTGAVGCMNAFRRNLYQHLPPNIIEDFTQPLMIISQNRRVVHEPEAICFERTTQNPSQEFKMRVRVIRGGMLGFLYAFKKLKFKNNTFAILQLFMHKIMRWLMPVFLILLFLLSIFYFLFNRSPEINFLFLSQILFYSLAIIGFLLNPLSAYSKVFAIPTYFVVVNLASLVALYLTVTSKLEASWETNVY